jgi:hypothetical protein
MALKLKLTHVSDMPHFGVLQSLPRENATHNDTMTCLEHTFFITRRKKQAAKAPRAPSPLSSRSPSAPPMARAVLHLSAELERAFADAQSGRVRFVKAKIEGEAFVLSGSAPATSDPHADCARLAGGALSADEAAFVLLCLDVNVAALRWVLLAFVPEDANVRDKMLYSSARESLKKQLGMNYFAGEFHATELVCAPSDSSGSVTRAGLEL